jgi:uncharacterized membrane protein YfcA
MQSVDDIHVFASLFHLRSADVTFDLVVVAVGVVAGAIASIAGFGVGSLLTPTLAWRVGTKLGVAAVAIPHFIGTFQRFWLLRPHVDRRMLLGFGLASAGGGLAGALAHVWLSSRALEMVFGALLILAAIAEFTGWMARFHWGRRAAWVAGALSGAFGGLVGNQGSIRSAALLGFDVPKESFVATATAIGLFVDCARLPVYLFAQWREIVAILPLIVAATIGVVVGTAVGARALTSIPRTTFRRIVALLLLALGIYMLAARGA